MNLKYLKFLTYNEYMSYSAGKKFQIISTIFRLNILAFDFLKTCYFSNVL